MAEEQKKKRRNIWLVYLICVAVCYLIGAGINYYQTQDLIEAATSTYGIVGLVVGHIVWILYLYLTSGKKNKEEGAKTKGKTAQGEEVDLAFNAKFIKPSEIKDQFGAIDTTWGMLPQIMNTGIVIRSTLENGKYRVSMKDEYHTMVIGATASGKTHLMIVPTIRILAHTGEKPDMIISDPKGELYQQTSKILADEGYRVFKYDLRDPFSSSRWNPMSHAYEVYRQAKDFHNHVIRCKDGSKPEARGYRSIPGVQYGDVWYGFNQVAFPTEEEVRKAVESTEQIYTDQAYAELKEIATTLCARSTAPDPTWEEGAQNLLYGTMLAMLEDSDDPRLGMTLEKFNFYNLYRIIMFADNDSDNPYATLKKYLLEGRDENKSEVSRLTANIIGAATNTAKSYVSILSNKISFMQDIGISYLTSQNDIDFATFTDKPSVLYIVIPDDKEERYTLANLCISQLYKRLVDKANSLASRKLPRHVYFILDEFGNLPAIPKFDSMITVARSRNILFELAIQSYTQLESKYGRENSETIKGNCNAQIFIGTDDQLTRDDFSKRCGEVQLIYEEENKTKNTESGNTATKSTSVSTSVQRTTRPLITPYELGQLQYGNVIVKLYRWQPIKVKLTPDYETPFFRRDDVKEQPGLMKSLDKDRIFYSIRDRNEKIRRKSSNPYDF